MNFIQKLLGVNWRTTAAGAASILGALADIAHSLSVGTKVNWDVDGIALVTGIGLINGKDKQVHSTMTEVQAATNERTPVK